LNIVSEAYKKVRPLQTIHREDQPVCFFYQNGEASCNCCELSIINKAPYTRRYKKHLSQHRGPVLEEAK
jgi:hypothetical protein